MKSIHVIVWCALGMASALVGCDREPEPAAPREEPPAQTNRIDIPAPVRQNLGITFAKVEARPVERTLRVPGRFELLPTARREYRAMLPGRVELLVEQYERVEAGQPLFTIDSPAWRDLQGQLTDAVADVDRHTTRLASFGPLREAHRNHETLLGETVEIRRQRVAQLEAVAEAGGGRQAELNEARGGLTTAQAELAEVLEKEAVLEADEAETRSGLAAARARLAFLLDSAGAIVGRSAEELKGAEGEAGKPLWRTIGTIRVVADEPGVVEALGLTNGAWASEESAVVTVVRPDRLRFVASGLQSDLGRLRDGLEGAVVPPSATKSAGLIPLDEAMPGTLTLGLSADAASRTIELILVPDRLAPWARAGVAAHLEVVTEGTGSPALAVPLGAVQRDGLRPVLFRRDPQDPNKAIRLDADLGLDDGRWVVVRSGLALGDEVVLDGAFQLMLATSGTQQQGGHFHADGTFHEAHD